MADYGSVFYQTTNHNKDLNVPEDWAKALYWFEKAGNAGSMQHLALAGRMYVYGNGCKVDKEKGFAMLKKASKHGKSNENFLLELTKEDINKTEKKAKNSGGCLSVILLFLLLIGLQL